MHVRKDVHPTVVSNASALATWLVENQMNKTSSALIQIPTLTDFPQVVFI